MKKTICRTRLGVFGLDVQVDTEFSGGSGISRHPKTGLPTIVVGISSGWNVAVEVLIHEAFEMAAVLRGLRYREDGSCMEEGSGHTIFIMTHEQMDKSIEDIAPVIADAMPPLAKAHRALHKD